MTFELFKEDPVVFFSVFLVNLLYTLIIYGLFPLLFAKFRRKPISEKKYKVLCYLINGFFCFCSFIYTYDSNVLNLAPYLLWTLVFVKQGKKILFSKDILNGYLPTTSKAKLNTSSSQSETVSDNNNSINESLSFLEDCSCQSDIKETYPNTQSESNQFESIQICKVQSSDGTKQWNTYWPDEAYQNACSKLYTYQNECIELNKKIDAEKQNAVHLEAQYNSLYAEHLHTQKEAKNKKTLSIIMIILFVLLAIGSVFYISKQAEEIELFKLKNYELSSELNNFNVSSYKPEYYFYHANAVIVVSDSGEKYHMYGCQYTKNGAYNILDKELAIYLGYEPCSSCYKEDLK